MMSLFDYEVLVNEVFYKCWHILEWILKHPDMSELDKEAISATIMEALVTTKCVNPEIQSLDLENLCIVDDLKHYVYQKHPNISGIPLWMKEEFRKKALYITGGLPISMFLAKPPSQFTRYCVYDPNTAVSSIFEDAIFYNSIYDSPTRGIRIESVRPFVEVNIDGEDYLVDTLTKRILKSSWFKETYNFEVIDQQTISKLTDEKRNYYQESISEHKGLAEIIPFILPILELNTPEQAEMKYEVEQSKKYFPEEWERYEMLQKEMDNFFVSGNFLIKKEKQ